MTLIAALLVILALWLIVLFLCLASAASLGDDIAERALAEREDSLSDDADRLVLIAGHEDDRRFCDSIGVRL